MLGRDEDRAAAHELERAVLFGLVDAPSRSSQALASLRRWALAIPIALFTMLGAPVAAALADTYLVSNANSTGSGSLRAAITLANGHAGGDTITVAPGVGQLTIVPQTSLPALTGPVFFNGDGKISINDTLNKGNALVLGGGSGGSTVEGATLYGASTGAGLLVQSSANVILGLTVGDSINRNKYGIFVQSNNNTIAGSGNTVIGSTGGGIVIQAPSGGTANGNFVGGNFIGTDAAGDGGLGNARGGVVITKAASNNVIGGSSPGSGNVISSNGAEGVLVASTGTTNNLVEGNLIGTTPSGSAALPNQWGVVINSGAANDTLVLNTVAGNIAGGVRLNGTGTSGNQVIGNFVGTDSAGDGALGNGGNGVQVDGGATSNSIGRSAAGAGNVISGNKSYGLLLSGGGTGDNAVQGNLIGTTPSGSAALPNQWGVGITGGAANDTLVLNTVAGNTTGGFHLNGTGTSNNLLQGNFIGTNSQGSALGNGRGNGIFIDGGASTNTIGGTQAGQGNHVGFNSGGGVILSGSTTTGDALYGNLIFSSGPNRSGPGIRLVSGANGNEPPPVITAVVLNADGTTTIHGTGGNGNRVEVFSNSSCGDPEGAVLLGATTVDSTGKWTLGVSQLLGPNTGVTALQTDATKLNTSPFSGCRRPA